MYAGAPLFRKKWLNNLCVRVGVRAYLCVRSLISHLNLVKCEPINIKLYMDIAGHDISFNQYIVVWRIIGRLYLTQFFMY